MSNYIAFLDTSSKTVHIIMKGSKRERGAMATAFSRQLGLNFMKYTDVQLIKNILERPQYKWELH
jgi:hypothetical protein